MTNNVFIEYRHTKVSTKKIEERVKEIWKGLDKKVKDIVDLHIYFKSEEGMCYYVINNENEGCFSIESLDI